MESPQISYVISHHAESVKVDPVAAGEDRVRIAFGDVSLYLSSDDAKLLSGDLLFAAVMVKAQLLQPNEGAGA